MLTAQYEKGNWYLDVNSSASLSVPLGDDRVTTEFVAQTVQTGYFFTDRLLIGSRIEFDIRVFPGFDFSFDAVSLGLRPFARYYFPGGEKRKVSYFGEVGFGGFYISSTTFIDPDYHFGGGAEVTLFPGVVGTATLRYDANYFGRSNAVNLTFGANLLLGQLEKPEDKAVVRRGTFTTTGSLGGAYFGRKSFSSESDGVGGLALAPNIGYFLADGLMVEAQLSLSYLRFKNVDEGLTPARSTTNDFLNTSVEFNLRYYLIKSGAFLPYVTGGGGYQDYWAKSENSLTGERISEFTSLFYRAGAGTSWFLSPNVALDGNILLRSLRYENDNTIGPLEKINSIQAEVGLRLFMGK